MSRLVPYRAKVPELVKARIEQTLATTMYLVQTSGPTSYVIQEQNSEKKHKVLIGALQNCSCGDRDVCVHILFVMLKILRVPATVPVVWQKSLIDSEVEMLLRGDYRDQSRVAPPKTASAFLKKRRDAAVVPQTDVDGSPEAERHELVEGEVCAICQEDMETNQPLTFCRKGCGNNFHIECMKVFGESRKQSKENIICPLCRQDWGDTALVTLKKEIEAANRAPNVHKGVACKKCHVKPIRCARYLCIQCKCANLCERCFKSGVHSKHAFVLKQAPTDSWVPAVRESERKERIGLDLVEELQNRELSNNDYDLLLQLDQSEQCPIQDYLLARLGGDRVAADNAKAFGEPGAICQICRQSLRIHADVRTIVCGHAFHESCLARSVLSQVYTCPHPDCEYVLFPGLRQLQMKETKRASTNHDAAPRLPGVHDSKAVMPALECAFSVLALQQRGGPSATLQQQSLPPTSRHGKTAKSASQPPHGRDDKCEQKLPPMLGLHSVGLTAVGRSEHALAAVAMQSNQAEHAEASTHVQRKPSTSHATARHSRAAVTLPRFAATSIPMSRNVKTLSSLAIGSSGSTDRMDQAERIRLELQQNEKQRLRKQRLQREERARARLAAATQTDRLDGFVGASAFGESSSCLDAKLSKAEESRSATHKRSQDERERKRKVREEQQRRYQEQQQQQQQQHGNSVLDMYIGGAR